MPKETTKKNVGGRPKKQVDAEKVYKAASYGCTYKEIGDILGVSSDTIKRRFRKEVELGKAHLKQRLRKAQISLALEGNATMLIWLGKNMLNQSDNGTFEEDELLDDVEFDLDDPNED